MGSNLRLGAHVIHHSRGLGKVVHLDETIVHVYFKDRPDPLPEDRIGRFRPDSWHLLRVVQPEPDPLLDNLPPWDGKAFARFKTQLTIDAAKSAFLRRFPGGFDDREFNKVECNYKREANRRFTAEFLPAAGTWIGARDASALCSGLEQVYGKHLPSDVRLNLLFARAEEPAYFDALRAGGEIVVTLAAALIAFRQSGSEADLQQYINAVAKLPQRPGGASTFTWPTVTWLPFVAAPDRCIMIKPTIMQSFASASAREIGYQSEPNAKIYLAMNNFAQDLRDELMGSEVNLSGRKLDMIDVQSFMWVVERYA